MISRLQLNSRDAMIDVYKSLPTLEVKKRYALSIESLTVPPMNDGLILNQALFSVERRLRPGELHTLALGGNNPLKWLPNSNAPC